MRALRSMPTLMLLLFGFRVAWAQPTNTFLIHVADAPRKAVLQVHSYLTGEFGGFGGCDYTSVDKDGLLIPTEYEGKPAQTLKAVLYSAGCEIQTIRVDNLGASPREADFNCHKLPNIKLEGKIDSSAIPFDQDSEVRVQYVAPWAHQFFGITDGPIMRLDVGSVSLEPDGVFVIDLPGFASDPVSSNSHGESYFELAVRDKKTGNIRASLKVCEPHHVTPGGDLKIELAYPTPVRFVAQPRR